MVRFEVHWWNTGFFDLVIVPTAVGQGMEVPIIKQREEEKLQMCGCLDFCFCLYYSPLSFGIGAKTLLTHRHRWIRYRLILVDSFINSIQFIIKCYYTFLNLQLHTLIKFYILAFLLAMPTNLKEILFSKTFVYNFVKSCWLKLKLIFNNIFFFSM